MQSDKLYLLFNRVKSPAKVIDAQILLKKFNKKIKEHHVNKPPPQKYYILSVFFSFTIIHRGHADSAVRTGKPTMTHT